MRILVIGCGSIGRRHIRLLREMGVEVVAYDYDYSVQKAVANEYSAIDWLDLPSASEKDTIDAINCYAKCGGAIIATPPDAHWVSWYSAVRKASLPALIEKPLAVSLTNAEETVETTRYKELPLLVGYNLRFHPGLRRVKELLDSGCIGVSRLARIHFGSYLPEWRPGNDYRLGYATKRASGGGVLLDASHELDYACWLFGEPVTVSCVAQNTGALEIETEDVADITVTFASGVQANIHLDYLSRQYGRGCEIIGDQGNVFWSLKNLSERETPDREMLSLFKHDTEIETMVSSPDDMYRAELTHFLACLRGEEQPLCTGEDGLRALRLALASRESAETGRVVRL